MPIQFEGPWVVRQLAEAKKKGDKKKIQELERVLANLMSTPSSDSRWDPGEEAWLGYTAEKPEKRVSRKEPELGTEVAEVEAGSRQ